MPSRHQVASPPVQPVSGPAPTSDASATFVPRAPLWTKPVLSLYGDVRQLTMGASQGVLESSNPSTFHT